MFITFEGIDGSGKTTQINLLHDYLLSRGQKVLLTREPGGTDIGTDLRNIVLDPARTEMSPRAEIFIYSADRAQHVDQIIRPALDRGIIVICDRYTDSTIAYQCYGRGLPINLIDTLNNESTQGLMPDITFYLALTTKAAADRFQARKETSDAESLDRLENEPSAFHGRVCHGFETLSAEHPDRIIRIDASGTVENTWSLIRSHIEKFIL